MRWRLLGRICAICGTVKVTNQREAAHETFVGARVHRQSASMLHCTITHYLKLAWSD
jgi:hypothetical protein